MAAKQRHSAHRGANPNWLKYLASATARKPAKTSSGGGNPRSALSATMLAGVTLLVLLVLGFGLISAFFGIVAQEALTVIDQAMPWLNQPLGAASVFNVHEWRCKDFRLAFATPTGFNQIVKYWAFISYSHKDTAIADWLHQKLETYCVPKSLVGTPCREGEVPSRRSSAGCAGLARSRAMRRLIVDVIRVGRKDHRGVDLKWYSLRLTFRGMVIGLGILTSCTAQTTRPTRASEVKDRHNFRDEQEGAPRVNNAPIDR